MPPPPPLDPPARWPLIALILASSLLAFGPVLVRLTDVGPVSAAFWRMGLAAPVLVLGAALLQRRRPHPGVSLNMSGLPWKLATISGLFFAADLAVWHMGIVRTTIANATLFANSAAFMLPAWAILVARQKPATNTLRALVLAGIGTLLLLGTSAQLSPKHLAGDALSLLAAAFYTGYLLVVMQMRDRLPTSVVLAMSTLASAVLLLPVALLEPAAFWPTDWRPVVALAVSSQILGQALMVFASGRLPPAVLGVGLLIQPIVSATAAWLLFAEALGPLEILGVCLVLAALVLVRR